MMFESVPIPAFNPMRDVWLPLDLSNPASFNVMMAHSSAHLAYFFSPTGPGFRGTNSPEALRFKSDAIKILNQWLNDPEKALGKDAFVAVVRLLTFEVGPSLPLRPADGCLTIACSGTGELRKNGKSTGTAFD